MEKEEHFFMKRMEELAAAADRQYRPVYSGFLTLSESSMLLSSPADKLAPVSIQLWGGYEEAERRLLCFSPLDFPAAKEDFPIACLSICPKNKKFSDPLSHRDFLGAVLNLGIDRSRTGDILIRENCAWLFCEEEIAGFIEENLKKIKHTMVFCERISWKDLPPEAVEPHLQEVRGFVKALRLDAVAAVAFHVSRSSMASCIQSEKVFVNGRMVKENSYQIKENDVISVRGMGKFRYQGMEGESKKGRLAVKIERYR